MPNKTEPADALDTAAKEYAYGPDCVMEKNSRDSWPNPEAAFKAGAKWQALRNQSLPADALVEAMANTLANADLDGPDPDDYWEHLVRAALSTLPDAVEAEQWQPIETAPKDGTRFLATDKVNVTVCEWKSYHGRWEHLTGWNHLYGARWNGPIYWRPLPAPPAAIRKGTSHD